MVTLVCATLTWSTRIKVALDVAEGLASLHGAEYRVQAAVMWGSMWGSLKTIGYTHAYNQGRNSRFPHSSKRDG